ncbi:glycine--tRNA ligase-like [Homalodisca vitripennis]|uniref:glycine--tRNA ligase-like n=1 Tax=Homalodisca vitripennis TaxID=197043 RepID=UPI001EE9BBB8|nr:glycine--tRNA ligase-like [Homalodisca vitripennis]
MAEIEHFCDPRDKSHPKFASVRDTVMKLYSACNQMDGKSAESMTIGEAVDKGLVANETLGYFHGQDPPVHGAVWE